jgi:thiol:disulfide interchange protein DsbC
MKKTLLLLSLAYTISVSANENVELEYIQNTVPNTKIAKYKKSFIDGFYEVYLDNGNIMYVNPFKEIFFVGEMVSKNGQSITAHYRAKWQEELAQKQISDLTVDKLIANSKSFKYGKGSGDVEFVIFTDPQCPFCVRVEEFLEKKDATIHINYLPLPMHKNAKELSLKALSAKDFKKAHQEAKKGEVQNVKEISKDAEQKLENMMSLAEELKIKGTPKIFVIDRKKDEVVDVINGADTKKLEKYLKSEVEK